MAVGVNWEPDAGEMLPSYLVKVKVRRRGVSPRLT